MSRLAVAAIATFILTCSSLNAQEPHKAWWRYLNGEWSYEIHGLDRKGKSVWRMASKRNALIGRFTEPDGLIGAELSGWRSESKKLVVHGFGSKGNYWHLELQVTKDTLTGPHHGMLPDGRIYDGKFTATRVDKNKFTWESIGKTNDGKELKLAATFKRNEMSARRATRKEFAELVDAMSGTWKGNIRLINDIPGIGKKGDKKSVTVRHTPTAAGKALVGKGEDGAGGEASTLMYFDLATQRIRRRTVFNGGSVVAAVVFKHDGKWAQVATVTDPGGKKTETLSTLEISNNGDTHTWTTDGVSNVWNREKK